MFKGSRKLIAIFDNTHPIWSEGFRPFFLLLPLYVIISIIPWGLIWGGVLHIPFSGQLLHWHIYEMVHGLGMAGILGFLLTAIPEFIEGTPRVKGYQLALLMVVWLLGRCSFWLYNVTGLWVNCILHVGLSIVILTLLVKPIWRQPDKRHIGLWWCVLLLTVLQALFFMSQSNGIKTLLPDLVANITPVDWLYASITAFMMLIVLVLRRVCMGATNTLLEQYHLDDKFIARPPMFNLAVASLGIMLWAELFIANQAVLGWLAWAVACALLNLLNDFFKLPIKVIFWHHIRYLCLLIVLMAIGYFTLGISYLDPEFNALNHLRHILTTGVIGLAYLIILSIVVVRHTGRKLRQTYAVDMMVFLVLLSLSLRLAIIPFPALSAKLYMWSALIWALAFAVYVFKYGGYLVRRNVVSV